MSNHHSEEDEKNYPDECDSNKHRGDSTLACRENVGQNGGYNYEEGQRRKRIARRNIYILKATLTIEEGGQTPVRNSPKRNGNSDGKALCEYRGVAASGVEGISLTDRLVEECSQNPSKGWKGR